MGVRQINFDVWTNRLIYVSFTLTFNLISFSMMDVSGEPLKANYKVILSS